jgi:hypothetical protein
VEFGCDGQKLAENRHNEDVQLLVVGYVVRE